MENRTLPKGLHYRIERNRPGVFTPGTEDEPIVTIWGRGATVRIRLANFALKKDYYADEPVEGDLEQKDLDGIDTWVERNLPSLFSEAKIRHLIYFVPGSQCYYDFFDKLLYGGNGYREKKGHTARGLRNKTEIDGKPCSFTKAERSFVDILTAHPNTTYDPEVLMGEDATGINSPESLKSKWNAFRAYDSSIRATFLRRRGSFVYEGSPQIWKVEGENEAQDLSIERLFKVLSSRSAAAMLEDNEKQLRTVLASNASSRDSLSFLGLTSDLLDPEEVNTARLVKENYFDSPEYFKQILNRYSLSLEGVWSHLRDSVARNYAYSLSASSFYSDTGELPEQMSDLSGYRAQKERVDNSLKRICPEVEKLIRGTKTGSAFFNRCRTDVAPDKAADYIASLILLCFCVFRTDPEDGELSMLRDRYERRVARFIRQKFGFDPSGGAGGDLPDNIEEIIRRLYELEETALADGLDYYASELAEIRNLHNLGYRDENGLLPPSMDR